MLSTWVSLLLLLGYVSAMDLDTSLHRLQKKLIFPRLRLFEDLPSPNGGEGLPNDPLFIDVS